MKPGRKKAHLQLVKPGAPSQNQTPPPSSIVLIEIDPSGALRRLVVDLRKEDAIQALQGLAMANLRALDILAT